MKSQKRPRIEYAIKIRQVNVHNDGVVIDHYDIKDIGLAILEIKSFEPCSNITSIEVTIEESIFWRNHSFILNEVSTKDQNLPNWLKLILSKINDLI